MYLAWKSINDEADSLNLTPHQQRQATSKLTETNETVAARIEETFVHVLTPKSLPGAAALDWEATKPSGYGSLAERVANKLQSEEKLISAYGGVRVRMDLDRVPLWLDTGDIVVGDLWSAYANHPYMPRLASFDVLAHAISNGTANMNWQAETFAYADAKDDGTWLGVSHGTNLIPTRSGILIRPDSLPPEGATPTEGAPEPDAENIDEVPSKGATNITDGSDSALATHFYARFELDPVRGIRQLEEIMTNVVNHLESTVTITLELEAEATGGFDDRVRRIAEENANQLGAQAAEFE